MIKKITINTAGQGLYEITNQVTSVVQDSDCAAGICNIFLRHTSAGLTIQENADPSAKRDLENWIKREVKENDPNYTHTFEGPDDMPAHIKSVITGCSLTVPVEKSSLLLGTWQGIYLWEYRNAPQARKVVVAVV